MNNIPDDLKAPFTELLLSIADDKFILGHRMSDWTGLAPILEEDIAFSAISQEEIAHAAELYRLAAPLLGTHADALAFGRKPQEYRCANLVELADDFNWATAIARQFFCDHLDVIRFDRLSRSSYEPLAALARRIKAEEAVHVDHADTWMIHLGGGGDDARGRMQEALEALSPHAAMLFEPTDGVERLEKAGICPKSEVDMFDQWSNDLSQVIEGADLKLRLDRPAPEKVGGRRGRRSDGFVGLLDELAEVFRQEPEAAW